MTHFGTYKHMLHREKMKQMTVKNKNGGTVNKVKKYVNGLGERVHSSAPIKAHGAIFKYVSVMTLCRKTPFFFLLSISIQTCGCGRGHL